MNPHPSTANIRADSPSTSPEAAMRGARFLRATALAAAACGASPAMACSDLPNICEQHRMTHERNVDMARQQSEAYARGAQAQAAQPAPPPGPDPTQLRIDAATAALRSMQGSLGELDKYAKDPRYAEIFKGRWHYFQDAPNARPGEFCAALFENAVGMVRVSGPGADYNGALLTFWGPRIPKPAAVSTISVTLTQSDSPKPQTVKAFNYTTRSADATYGAIALAVPTADALLDNMLDKLGFKLEVNGEQVLEIGWHSGLQARDRLKRCIRDKAVAAR